MLPARWSDAGVPRALRLLPARLLLPQEPLFKRLALYALDDALKIEKPTLLARAAACRAYDLAHLGVAQRLTRQQRLGHGGYRCPIGRLAQ